MKVGAIPLAIYRYGDILVSGLHRRTFGCYKCCPQATLLVIRLCDAGPDPTKPFLELVGVYPVIGGFAQLNVQNVLGKAQTADAALHFYPGDPLNSVSIPLHS